MARTTAGRGKPQTAAQHFAQVPSTNVPRSKFDRSNDLISTFDAGDLVPIFLDEVLPGDTVAMNMQTFVRMATPLHPIMDTQKISIFFFSVPLRLVWENFQKFMGEQDSPGDTIDFTIPQITPGAMGQPEGTLWDYMGLPLYSPNLPSVSSLFFRSYNRVWAEWFRDENLQDGPDLETNDSDDLMSQYPIRKRGKRHDYFTSALPWPQKGPAVELPLGTSAPVITNEENPLWINEALTSTETEMGYANTSNLRFYPKVQTGLTELDTMQFGSETGLKTDLSLATAATINEFRTAMQIQKLYERDARGGTRYTEILRSHFGVISPDQRLQRPEYLGGGTMPINVQPVTQTSGTIPSGSTHGDPSAQGNLAAFVTGGGHIPSWIKSFTEHSIIIGLACVTADLHYQQNVNKMWKRETKHDFYWPALAHLGEQAIQNSEIFWDSETPDGAANTNTWGYQERWAEYRYKPSTLTGKMRSEVTKFGGDPSTFGTLDSWHLALDFGATPLLNDAFIQEDPPVARVTAVPTEPTYIFNARFNYHCTRPMPTYSVPGITDRF